jgi:membrane protease YdiL (CAAX protease family)
MEPQHVPTLKPRTPTPHPIIAWVIVAILVGMTAVATAVFTQSDALSDEPTATSTEDQDVPDEATADAADDDADATDDDGDAADDDAKPQGGAMVTLQGKMMLGELLLSPGSTSVQALVQSNQPLQRIRGAVLLGVTSGEAQAGDVLQDIADDGEASEAARALAMLTTAALDGEAGKDDQALLVRDLGYFGELAWAKGHDAEALSSMKDAARGVVLLVTGILLGVLGLALIGLILCIVALVRLSQGTMRSRMVPGDAIHGLYVETFLVWFLLLNGLSIVAAVVAEAADIPVFAAMGVGFVGSLLCLAWPSVRGSTFARTRIDIGWTRGVGIVRELGAGVVCWLGMLPILGVGILGTIVLMLIAGVQEGDAEAPSHPIVESFSAGPLPIAALVLAVVLAPLVEETVFRGLLYRQLRSVGAFGRTASSCLVSAALTGFIFAVIHPQGWMGIPALMSIGFAMALAREWRGSLIAPMVMHGLNNGLVLAGLLIMLRY